MVKGICLLVLGMVTVAAKGQFFYQDVIAAEQSARHFSLMKKLGIKKMEATSYDPDGNPTPNFQLFQRVEAGKYQVTTYSKSDYTGTSVLTTYFTPEGKILQVVDSSSTIVNKSVYQYNAQGKLQEVSITANDNNQSYTLAEKHYFQYDDSGRMKQVWRVKNGKDSSLAVFVPSENGLPGEEQWWKNNQKIESWFYYYDDSDRLTDIVRYNARARQMLPDYMFEYDEAGRISRQTTVHASTGLYRVWTYTYDSRGLKVGETVLNKYKQPEGRIEYRYQ